MMADAERVEQTLRAAAAAAAAAVLHHLVACLKASAVSVHQQ